MLGDIERVVERPGALLEGPRLTADGAVLYSDVTGGGVYRDGDVVVPKRRGIGGLVPHRDGGVVVTGRTVAAPGGAQHRVREIGPRRP